MFLVTAPIEPRRDCLQQQTSFATLFWRSEFLAIPIVSWIVGLTSRCMAFFTSRNIKLVRVWPFRNVLGPQGLEQRLQELFLHASDTFGPLSAGGRLGSTLYKFALALALGSRSFSLSAATVRRLRFCRIGVRAAVVCLPCATFAINKKKKKKKNK